MMSHPMRRGLNFAKETSWVLQNRSQTLQTHDLAHFSKLSQCPKKTVSCQPNTALRLLTEQHHYQRSLSVEVHIQIRSIHNVTQSHFNNINDMTCTITKQATITVQLASHYYYLSFLISLKATCCYSLKHHFQPVVSRELQCRHM